MIKARSLNEKGIAVFSDWLSSPSDLPPSNLIDDVNFTEEFGEYWIDATSHFASRFEFGKVLNDWFSAADFRKLMANDSDGLWAWLALVFFDQLTAKGIRRSEHYIVMRKGSAGSLAYRHAVRTSFELFHIHGTSSAICLRNPMHTFGDMTEQLASRQSIAHNRGFFQAASELYIDGGTLKRGASSKPKKPKDRKPGERSGLGSVRRLAIALQRLDLTYDTDEMLASQMKQVLPLEFKKFNC